jgi:hypothetical protein
MYAFVHIDKTGGTTLTSILRRSFGTRHCDIRLPLVKRQFDGRNHCSSVDIADLQRVERIYRKLRGISGHNVKAYSNLASRPDIQFVTVLRDPAARFRSHFLNRSRHHTFAAFERWVSDPMMQNWQTKMLAGEANAQKAIDLLATRFGFVWFTERFDDGLVMFDQWLQEPYFRAEYRRQNQLNEKKRPHDLSRQQTDISYLQSDSIRARIREANSLDQQVYDFVAANIYPRQIANFRGDLNAATEQLRCRNSQLAIDNESVVSRLMRNYIYKPLLHCRVLGLAFYLAVALGGRAIL